MWPESRQLSTASAGTVARRRAFAGSLNLVTVRTHKRYSHRLSRSDRTSSKFEPLLWITRKSPLLKLKTGGFEPHDTVLSPRVGVTLNLKIKLDLRMR